MSSVQQFIAAVLVGPVQFAQGRIAVKGLNDLATTNPELVSKWHQTKNGAVTPYDVTAKSNKKVWWIYESGHEWEAAISRCAKGIKCPYDAGKLPYPKK